jgi:hypothetical protein
MIVAARPKPLRCGLPRFSATQWQAYLHLQCEQITFNIATLGASAKCDCRGDCMEDFESGRPINLACRGSSSIFSDTLNCGGACLDRYDGLHGSEGHDVKMASNHVARRHFPLRGRQGIANTFDHVRTAG